MTSCRYIGITDYITLGTRLPRLRLHTHICT